MFIAAIIGLMIGLLSLIADLYTPLNKVFEPVAATVAAGIAGALSVWFGPYSVFNATLAGLILLMPGFTLTVALTELTTRNLVCKNSRLSGAMIVFFASGFELAGTKLTSMMFGTPRIGASFPLPCGAAYLSCC